MTSLSARHLGLQLQILTEITVYSFFLFEKIWKIEDFKPQGSFWLLKIFLMERKQKNILWPVKSKQKAWSYKVNVSFYRSFSRIRAVKWQKSGMLSQRDGEQEQN